MCPILCNPMDCSLPGSSVNVILQARIPEWAAISFSNKWIKLYLLGEKNPQHCKSLISPNSNDIIKTKKKDMEMLTLGPSDLVTWAGVTFLEPEQTWVPRLECLGSEGARKICLAMNPLPEDLETLQLCGEWREVLLQLNQAYCTQRMLELLGWKSFPGLQDSWWWGSQVQPPFLGSPHLRMTSPSIEWTCRN